MAPFILLTISNWVSSGFGSGHARIAPGTFGSAAALIFWFLLHAIGMPASFPAHAALFAVTAIVGTLAVAHSIDSQPEAADPPWIVIDEWAGLFIALTTLAPNQLGWIALGFGLFRLFDALKWGPVGWAEKLPGAWGIIADDVVAGALTALLVGLCRSIVSG
jgi:phosphatidylglycerophosphatase A